MNKKLFFLVILVNFGLLCGQYVFSSIRATDGQMLADLDTKLQEYTSQNRQLRNSIYSALALSRVQTEAERQHLSPVQASFLAPNPVAAAFSH